MALNETLKKMIAEPADKEWFKKYGTPKSKALEKGKDKWKPRKPRMLTEAERKEKTKDWPKGGESINTTDHQRRIGRAYSE